MAAIKRLGRQHVERSGTQAAFAQGDGDGVEINDAATGRVDENASWFHRSQRTCVDQALGALGQRAMQADDVALGEQIGKRGRTVQPQAEFVPGGQGGIEKHHAHLQRLRAQRHRRTDATQADNAKYLAGQAAHRWQ